MDTWRSAWDVPLLEVHRSIGSTNDRALELATEGARAYSVVLADEQTRGRGRHGSHWHSSAGCGLWMSILLPSAGEAPGWLAILVGLVTADAVEAATGIPHVGIKWPNDLHVGTRKVGGILCEAAPGGAVAGVGINLRTPGGGFPEGLGGSATSLEVEGANSLSISRLAGMILDGLKVRIAREGQRLSEEAVEELRARDVLLGSAVHTDEHGKGRALGIDADGALRLERPNGSRVRVVAGSVRPA